MAKDTKPVQAQGTIPTRPTGHGVVLVAVGPERYEVVYVETDGPPGALRLLRSEVPYSAKGDTDKTGKPLAGSSIHVALQDLNVVLTKRIREASKLWRRS